MINIEEMLKPIAGGKSCGEDFSYHPTYQNLETLSRGQAKTQFSPKEDPEWKEPDWKEVRDAALEVLRQSKHLGAGVILSLSLLKIGGLEGFRDGLAVIRGFLERFWADVYPKLDQADNNDPTERLNILNNLSSAGEPHKFILHLKQMVICQSPTMGRITLQQVLIAKDKAGKPESAPDTKGSKSDAGLGQIQAAFRDAGPDAAKATLSLVNEVIGHAKGIESFLDSTLGAGRGVNFDSLNKLLGEMKHAVEPYAPIPAPAASGGESAAATAVAPPLGTSAIIQTGADVVKALETICEYYRDNEPSSPVPLILRRAQKLVDKDFMSITTDLSPDSLPKLQAILGIKPEK